MRGIFFSKVKGISFFSVATNLKTSSFLFSLVVISSFLKNNFLTLEILGFTWRVHVGANTECLWVLVPPHGQCINNFDLIHTCTLSVDISDTDQQGFGTVISSLLRLLHTKTHCTALFSGTWCVCMLTKHHHKTASVEEVNILKGCKNQFASQSAVVIVFAVHNHTVNNIHILQSVFSFFKKKHRLGVGTGQRFKWWHQCHKTELC